MSMETTKIQLKSNDEIQARALGLTPGVYHMVIQEGQVYSCDGLDKNGQQYHFIRMEYTCVVVESLDPNIRSTSCQGVKTKRTVSTGKGEEDAAILGYNKGLLQSAGISVSDWGDTEAICSEVVGKEFNAKVIEDKNGYTQIQTRSLRMLNK